MVRWIPRSLIISIPEHHAFIGQRLDRDMSSLLFLTICEGPQTYPAHLASQAGIGLCIAASVGGNRIGIGCPVWICLDLFYDCIRGQMVCWRNNGVGFQ